MHTNENWAYLAGLIDGEGSLKRKAGRYFSVRIRINMTSYPTIKWLHDMFGGCMYATKQAEGKKQQWVWEVDNLGQQKIILTSTLPYLIEKRARAERVLGFIAVAQEFPPSSPTRREAWQQLESLNR